MHDRYLATPTLAAMINQCLCLVLSNCELGWCYRGRWCFKLRCLINQLDELALFSDASYRIIFFLYCYLLQLALDHHVCNIQQWSVLYNLYFSWENYKSEHK
jgi:hypothetical protein